MLYVTYVSPLVKKHEADIDRALEEGLRKARPRLCGSRWRWGTLGSH